MGVAERVAAHPHGGHRTRERFPVRYQVFHLIAWRGRLRLCDPRRPGNGLELGQPPRGVKSAQLRVQVGHHRGDVAECQRVVQRRRLVVPLGEAVPAQSGVYRGPAVGVVAGSAGERVEQDPAQERMEYRPRRPSRCAHA